MNRNFNKRRLTALLSMVVVGMTVSFSATVFAERETTESQEPERKKPWERVDLVAPSGSVTHSATREESVRQVEAQTLPSSWKAIQGTEYDAFAAQVQSNEDRLGALEARINGLETVDAWQEVPSSPPAYSPSGPASNYSSWSPAVSNQTSDFVQSRSYDQPRSRTVVVYEEHMATGERREKDRYTESQTFRESESRTIDVANNPNGGTDGWSDWYWTSGQYSCGSWTPSPSTVDEGRQYRQSQRCYRDRERAIYYLANGSVEQERRDTSRATVYNYRTATGTKQNKGTCRYNNNYSDPNQRIAVYFHRRDYQGYTSVQWKWESFYVEQRLPLISYSDWYNSDPVYRHGGYEYRPGGSVRYSRGDENTNSHRWTNICRK